MSINTRRFALAIAVSTLVVVVACSTGACGGDDQTADYEAHWYSTDLVGEWWLTIEPDGDGYQLTWERLPADRYTERATVQDGGDLLVEGSALGVNASELAANPERFYRMRLNDDGRLEVGGRTTEDKALSETTQPILTRGDDADYAAFRVELGDGMYERGLDLLYRGIQDWANQHGMEAPPVDEVRPGGEIEAIFKALGEEWPLLADGTPLRPGAGPGEYTYQRSANGFSLGGVSPSGERLENRHTF